MMAKKLRKQSCEVHYCGPVKSVDGDDLKKNSIKQGFSYVSLDPCNRVYFSQHGLKFSGKHDEIQFECFIFNLQDGKLYCDFINTYAPDLMVMDIHYMALVMPFLHKGISVLLASTKIGTDKDSNVPPLTSSIIPDGTLSTNKQIEKSWQALRKKNNGMQKYFKFLKNVAEERYQLDFDEYFYQDKCIVPFGFRLPELIFWDKMFDFPRTSKGLENKFYLGNQVDLGRKEKGKEISGEVGNNLIYVSLGTRWGKNIKMRIALLKEIIAAAKKLENYHFVLVVSNYRDQLADLIESSNITLLDFAPQIYILSRSVLMINHGGGNSVKECIRMGVPMLCYPSDNDQFGNAARVVYHKVGLRGSYIEKAVDVTEKITHILVNPEFTENVKKFQLRSIAAEESNDDVQIIKSFL